jgi:hypothetical protein
MTCLSVTCPDCGLLGELDASRQELEDPGGKCKFQLRPSECPALRVPLIGAVHILDLMEWDAELDNEETIQPLERLSSEKAIIVRPAEPSRISKRNGVAGGAADHKASWLKSRSDRPARRDHGHWISD